ncbi:protein kinase domain-containing protein [Fodinibius sp.]|uniref:protein kinase domain-containing protein n=1 Tax=Fodinibius sp. TaxID=1872440 RepID=UPI002ACD544A|nr:protein kinase [Fodinibius sp.]MDZ7659791.1 protein kinase [Fodinibius sp.]
MSSSYLHYEIVKKLGEGGMGIVYLAEDKKLSRQVALKFLPDHISSDPTERARFLKEARASAALNHPNIAQVYSIEEVDEKLFIVMEYVDGIELKEWIRSDECTATEQLKITEQIAEGIKAAHDKGIIHRDIKSNNIMITHTGDVKIMDFGIAYFRGEEHITKTGTTLGTTAYMSPEQLRGTDADEVTDIWSFGVVLYELFTQNLPFQGSYEPAIIYSITEEEPIPIDEYTAEVPERIRHIILRCLEKDREKRYSNFGEITADLKEDELESNYSVSPIKRWSNQSKSIWITGALSAIFLVLIMIVVGTPSSVYSRIPDKILLAVLPIEIIGENDSLDGIGVGLVETLSFRLTEVEKYVDSYWITPASELRKENVKSITKAKQLFGINLAISSSIQSIDDSTRLLLELVDADNMRSLETRQVVVSSNNLTDLEKMGVKAMLGMLNIDISSGLSESLLEGEPSTPKAYELYLKGLGALNDVNRPDHLDDAIRFFKHSISLDPDYALAHAGLGEAFWEVYERRKTPEYVDSARTTLHKAEELNENLTPIQVMLGRLNTGTGNYEAAIEHFKNALALDGKLSSALRGLASVYDMQGIPEKAEETYLKAIELKTDYWKGHKDLAVHYLQRGQYPSAIEQFQKVVDILPNNNSAHSNLGAAYLYNGQNEKARQIFERAMALENDPITANNLAYIYFSDGLYLEAAEMYELAVTEYSDQYIIWGNLAVAYELGGNNEEALRSYLKAIEKAKNQLQINPNNADVLADLGAYYSDIEDEAKALEFIEKALAIDPDKEGVRKRAVTTYEKLGMRNKALHWINAPMLDYVESQVELKELAADTRYLELKKNMKQ